MKLTKKQKKQIKEDTKRLLSNQGCDTCKPTKKQIKEDTKRLLRNQGCDTCKYRNEYPIDDKWTCDKTNSFLPLARTCYRYEVTSVEDKLTKIVTQEIKSQIDKKAINDINQATSKRRYKKTAKK